MRIEFSHLYNSLPVGWLDIEEALLLYEYARRTEGDILEICSFKGRSTTLLASLGRTIHAVDPFDNFDEGVPGDDIEKVFKENTSRFENVVLYRMRGEDWEPRPVGFAYLDGDHTYEGTVAQIKKALECNPQIIPDLDVNNSGVGVESKK